MGVCSNIHSSFFTNTSSSFQQKWSICAAVVLTVLQALPQKRVEHLGQGLHGGKSPWLSILEMEVELQV